MKHFRNAVFAVVMALSGALASAHPNGHGEQAQPITEQQAATRADRVIESLLNKQQLPASWQQRQLKETQSRDSANGKVWVVIYTNPAEKDARKKNLHVVFDEFGNLIETQVTGA